MQDSASILSALDALSLPAPGGPGTKANLLGTSREDLEAFALNMGEPKFRGEQIFNALYARHATSFAGLSNIPKTLRAQLEEHFTLERPRMDSRQVSTDGTRKYRFLAPDGLAYESVYIPEVGGSDSTNTLCISSQTGCAVGCKFCYTASLKRNRNLGAGEIIGQVLAVQEDVASLGDKARVTNIVFMGMGEPLLNFNEVVKAAKLLVDSSGLGFSTRRVTISTSGIVPRIYELGQAVKTQLAISLNATTDEIRTRIMPINKKWPLAELMKALRAYPLAPRRRITIEYVMLDGINDTSEDAYRLIDLLGDLPVKINMLPLNAHDRTEFATPSDKAVRNFQHILTAGGHNALVRTPRGRDISAACGQLGETVWAAAQALSQTPA